LHMRFRLAARLMTLDDLELLPWSREDAVPNTQSKIRISWGRSRYPRATNSERGFFDSDHAECPPVNSCIAQHRTYNSCITSNLWGSSPRFTCNSSQLTQESRAVAMKPRDAAAVRFDLTFADNIHYKFSSIQASKTRLQSSKHSGAKQNLTQNVHPRLFKVACFGVSRKATRD